MPVNYDKSGSCLVFYDRTQTIHQSPFHSVYRPSITQITLGIFSTASLSKHSGRNNTPPDNNPQIKIDAPFPLRPHDVHYLPLSVICNGSNYPDGSGRINHGVTLKFWKIQNDRQLSVCRCGAQLGPPVLIIADQNSVRVWCTPRYKLGAVSLSFFCFAPLFIAITAVMVLDFPGFDLSGIYHRPPS